MEVARKAYDEIVDYFARGTTAATILAFHPSLETQERVRYLLGRHKAGELTPQEVVELERFGELEHLMQLIKARAYLYAEQRL